ncbi:MAG: class I SAM-dependent methyltransferase [Acidobacteriota bacterium]
MSASYLSDPSPYISYHDVTVPSPGSSFPVSEVRDTPGLLQGIARRWRRERRRRKVGRAYDMALEIARLIPRNSSVLDVGCGNGYIAHHLSAMLGARVVGIDLDETTEAPIDYRRFDNTHFPVENQSFEAVLLGYVLHHAQDVRLILNEMRRALSKDGLAVVYEDIPKSWWDRAICTIHNLKWRKRTGPCSFRLEAEWRRVFCSAGFEIISEKTLSRWRNLAHPVSRRIFFLKRSSAA